MKLKKQAEELSTHIITELSAGIVDTDRLLSLLEAQKTLYETICYAPSVAAAFEYLDGDEPLPMPGGLDWKPKN